jgi:hypothetical protein
LYLQGKWEALSKAQGKKVKAQYEEEKRKQERTSQQEVIRKMVFFSHKTTYLFSQQLDAQRREEKLGEAKQKTIEEDKSLPKAEVVRSFFVSLIL